MPANIIGAIIGGIEKENDRWYDAGKTLIARKWAHDDRAHAERRQDELLRRMWEREDALRAEQFEREDTSYQRSVADARAAGLSPLAVNQLDSAGTPITASMASQPDVMSPSSYMSNSNASAGQLTSAYFSALNLDELKRHNKAMETNADKKLDNDFYVNNTRLSLQSEEISKNYEIAKEKNNIEEQKRLDAIDSLTQTLAHQELLHASEMSFKNKQQAYTETYNRSQQTYNVYKDFCKDLGVSLGVEYCDSLEEYNTKFKKFQADLISANRKYLNWARSNPDDTSDSVSDSVSGASADSYGLNASKFGAGVGGNMSNSVSSGFNSARNQSTKSRKVLQQYYNGLKCPVYFNK